jgi:DNA-binding HxlR family transcriptional regulator
MTDRLAARRYDDPCGIARALSVVGERWALLVVRELVFGPKRFADLRRGLGGVSPNVLSQRLAELESQAIVARTTLGPPVGAGVYQLTDHGRALLPVLDALAFWGSRLPITSERELSRDALLFAMRSTVRTGVMTTPQVRVLLDGVSWDAAVDGGVLEWRPPLGHPHTTLDTNAPVLRALVFGSLDLDAAVQTGQASVAGEIGDIALFIAAFERPQVSPHLDA